MTSEEINKMANDAKARAARLGDGHTSYQQADDALMRVAMLEIAYQLARFNEREEKTIEQIIAERGA